MKGEETGPLGVAYLKQDQVLVFFSPEVVVVTYRVLSLM